MKHRVFFQDELTARAAGYRPCGISMRTEYAKWKAGDGKVTEQKSMRSREPQTREGLISLIIIYQLRLRFLEPC